MIKLKDGKKEYRIKTYLSAQEAGGGAVKLSDSLYVASGDQSHAFATPLYIRKEMGGEKHYILSTHHLIRLTLNSNGGRFNEGLSLEYVSDGSVMTIPAVSAFKEGDNFVGWNTMADGSGFSMKEGGVITESCTLFAQWAEKEKYTITYRTNKSETLIDENSPYYSGTVIQLLRPQLAYKGYVFGGWYFEASLSTKAPEELVMDKDVQLYGKWIAEVEDIW